MSKTQTLCSGKEGWLVNEDLKGARRGVVGLGTILQDRKSRVRFPISLLDFSIDLILPAAMALGSTQPLTEMSTRNRSSNKGRAAHNADNLTSIYDPIV
jgi:hypothetical protein